MEKGTLSVQIDANLLEEFVRKATHGPNRRIHKTSLDALTTAVFYGFAMFLEDMEGGGRRIRRICFELPLTL